MKLRWRTISAWIAGLFSAAACSGIGGMECMYGMPTADYDVTLTVTDESGAPIKGIEATTVSPDHSYSDSHGILKMNFSGVAHPLIHLADIDGPENGGEFESRDVYEKDLDIKKVKDGDGAWYTGAYEVSGQIKLTKKTTSQ